MIRKVVTVGLTTGAVVSAVLWVGTSRRPIRRSWPMREPMPQVILALANGSASLMFLSTDDSAALSRGVLFALGPLRYERYSSDFVPAFPRDPQQTSQIVASRDPSRNLTTTTLVFPLWAPFVACIAYPAVAFMRGPVRRWRRRRKGLCINCGYDLTGNVSGVCPECGSAACAG